MWSKIIRTYIIGGFLALALVISVTVLIMLPLTLVIMASVIFGFTDTLIALTDVLQPQTDLIVAILFVVSFWSSSSYVLARLAKVF